MNVEFLEESSTLVLARYHSPALGRFLSVDPGFDVQEENPQSWNLYGYVRNNPVNSTDPDGKVANFLVGALIGGGVELAAQLISNGGKFSEVKWSKVAVSAAIGAATAGASAMATTVGAKVAAAAIGNVAEGALHSAEEPGKKYGLKDAAVDAVVGGSIEKLQSVGGRVLGNKIKTAEDKAKTLADVAASGRPRGAQTRRAEDAAATVTNLRRAQTATTSQTAGEVADKVIDKVTDK